MSQIQYFQRQLDNGLRIVAIPLKNNSNVISTRIFYKVGSRNEIMGKTGLAHILEHMSFKQTKKMREGEFDQVVKSFGGVNNATTGFDCTCYYVNSVNKYLDKTLFLFAQMMDELVLDDEQFKRERDVVYEEWRLTYQNSPMGFFWFKLFNNLFSYHPYHWTPIGFEEDIKNWNIEDLRAFYKTYYQPKNAIIVVAGDIEPKKVFKAVQKNFQAKTNSCLLPKFYMHESEITECKTIELFRPFGFEAVAVAFRLPKDLSDKDQLCLEVLAQILSSGKSCRFYKPFVQEKSIANDYEAYTIDNLDESVFIFFAVLNTGVQVEKALYIFEKEVQKIQQKGIKLQELKKIVTNEKKNFLEDLSSSSKIAAALGEAFLKNRGDFFQNYEKNLKKLTLKDIQKVAKMYLTPLKTIVILRNQNPKENQC